MCTPAFSLGFIGQRAQLIITHTHTHTQFVSSEVLAEEPSPPPQDESEDAEDLVGKDS